jgi:hypothetical protein
VSAAQAVASTQVNAVQALHDQDQRLRAEFRERERERLTRRSSSIERTI